MLHELWDQGDEGQTFCLAGPHGDAARAMLGASARLVWRVEAETHFDAMTAYWEWMGWAIYTTYLPEVDRQTYQSRGWA